MLFFQRKLRCANKRLFVLIEVHLIAFIAISGPAASIIDLSGSELDGKQVNKQMD